jgi:hypothetical protein
MILTITISLWSYLFCGPWSEPGKVFAWLRKIVTTKAPYWIAHPFIECAMCHAVWISIFYQTYNFYQGGSFGSSNVLSVLSASFLALLLTDFETLREKWKNS